MIPLYIFKFSPSSWILPLLYFLNHCLFKFSTFHLFQPFLHLDFLKNFSLLHFHLSTLFLPRCSWQKWSILSLSLQFSFSYGGFFYCFNLSFFFFSNNDVFCYYLFIFHIAFVSLFDKFVLTFMHIYIFWYSNSQSQALFLYPISLIWFGLIISCFAS